MLHNPTRGSSFAGFILLGEQVWQLLSSAASAETITPPAFAHDARLLLRPNQSAGNQGKKTNKSANGNERNKCLEPAKQKARKQSRDICQKWKKRQRFHFCTAATNRLPKQSHLFLLDLDLNWSYGQQIIHAQVLLRGGKVLKNKTPTKSAPCVWINVSACKHMATEQRSTSANSGVKAPISS